MSVFFYYYFISLIATEGQGTEGHLMPIIPLFSFIIANIAVPESLFLKNVLVYEKNFVTLCTGIGYMSPLVRSLKVTCFLRLVQGILCFCVLLYMHIQTSKT